MGGRIYTSEVEHVFFAAFIPRTRGNLVPFNGKPFQFPVDGGLLECNIESVLVKKCVKIQEILFKH